MLLTVVLGALMFRWSKDLWSARAGLFALFILTFDPSILAHGRLACTDVGTVTLGTAALYTTWRWLEMEQPTWCWPLGTGILLGLTMLAKASGVLWVAASALTVVGHMIFQQGRDQRFKLLYQGVIVGLISLLCVWGSYAFTVGHIPGLPFPLPAPAYWKLLFFQRVDADLQRSFALGMRTQGSRWWYFPLAFLIKNPLPLLFSLVISVIALSRRPSCIRRLFTLGLFPLLYVFVAIIWGRNVSYRYMLPIHPFLYLLLAGGLDYWVPATLSRRSWMVLGLSTWLVFEALKAFPNEIAYFNQLVGGPSGGYRYLSDSNVAWGQSSKALYAYTARNPEVNISRPETRFVPAPGYYLVNASQLQGMNIDDPYAYEWFRHRQPLTTVHDTLLLYKVPAQSITWVAQCTIPAPPLRDDIIDHETGKDDLRKVTFDCAQSWVYPEVGRQNGLYALHHDLVPQPGLCFPNLLRCPPVPEDPFIARHLEQAKLSYEQEWDSEVLPAFLLYQMSTPNLILDYPGDAYAAYAEAIPSDLINTPYSFKVFSFEGRISLQGVKVYTGEGVDLNGPYVEVETWWKLAEGPIRRPISIMAHLLTAQGEVLGIADGLGVPSLYFQRGDIIVQRHRFGNIEESGNLWLRTGVYWLSTSERWVVLDTQNADAVFVHLEVK
jgi:hypothetical protein